MTDIDHLRALLAEVTPGPWVPGSSGDEAYVVTLQSGTRTDRLPPFGHLSKADVRLIVEAVNALPALLDELERLREMLGRLVSLGWIMDSLPEDLALDLYYYDRPVLSPEPKP